ncbi:hypothetical protein RZS08_55895, partial [Arthrospira platensis SPKY1]|nr:hypothetical protein [Arthrospira platensis SPKY1]
MSSLPDWQMDQAEGLRKVLEILGLLNLQGFGIDHDHPGLGPAGALLFYAEETLRTQPANIQRLRLHENRGVLIIDPATQRNLELVRASHTQTREGSLLAAMDATVTAPGARLLEQFLTAAT